ncbi:MAG: symmetrical bis(5'-nucleosyl)-tetraphosphatase, partial [Polaromonas sp.]|nr:symmetrical bis(5'-nucleosyl)-tetraphosphatase [Polaromonas sp.]
GPDSLGVLRSLMALGDAAQCLLGNHDLHLLALWQGVRKPGRKDTLTGVLQAPDSDALMSWLRHRAMAINAHGWLMVHAGVLPQWSVTQAMALAGELESVLRGPDIKSFLTAMYGNKPTQWHDTLEGNDRLRVIVNALTRLRFCTAEGEMEFTSSEGTSGAPAGYLPWFAVAGRASANTPVAFGHWSTLVTEGGAGKMRSNTLPLDTGCVWGGCLSAARLGAVTGEFELIQVKCEQAQKPAA